MNLNKTGGKNRFLIFLICYLSYLSIYVARMNLSIASSALESEGVLTTVQIGLIGTVFAVVYAVGRIVNGRIGDVIQPKIMVFIGLTFVAISNLVLSLMPSYLLFFILWGINAFGQSMLWGVLLRVINSIYSDEKAKKMSSALSTSIALGNVISIILNTFLIEKFGLKYAFIIPGIITAILSVVSLLLICKLEKAETAGEKVGIFTLLKNPDMQKMCISIFLHGIVKDNVSFWVVLYFSHTFGIDLKSIAFFALLIPTLGFVARTVFPFLYKLFKNNEFKVSIVAYILSALSSVALIIFSHSIVIVAICFGMIYAMMSIVNTCALAVYPLKFTKENGVSTVSGIMDLCAYSGYGLGTLVFGLIIDKFGYGLTFIIWAVCSVLGMILMCFIKKEN